MKTVTYAIKGAILSLCLLLGVVALFAVLVRLYETNAALFLVVVVAVFGAMMGVLISRSDGGF